MDDVAVLKPTLFPTVPRILNRLYSKIVDTFKSKEKITDPGLVAKIRTFLGGRVKAITTGSAPINPEVLEFLRAAFGCAIHEGYGQTETLITTITHRDDNTSGTIGGPMPNCKFRLRDIPEMNYSSTNTPPKGEL